MSRSLKLKTSESRDCSQPLKREMAAEVPLGRYGMAEEAADLIVFLGLQNVDPKEFQPSNGRASSKG